MTASTLLWTALALLGLALGSFANVVIYRSPRKPEVAGTVTMPAGSYCPSCRSPIRFYDNIPLLSYILLKGHCRACHARIPVRYPLVEAASALLIVSAVAYFGPNVRGAIAAWFLWVLLVLAVIDGLGVPKSEYANPSGEDEDSLPEIVHVLPDKLVLPSLAAALSFAVVGQVLYSRGVESALVGPTAPVGWASASASASAGGWLPLTPPVLGGLAGEPLVSSFVGLLVGGGFLYVLALARPGGMGGGDVKLAGFLGLLLGLWVLMAIFIGSASGAVVGGALMLIRRHGRRHPIPFGPFLGLGAVVTLFFGPTLVGAYLRAVGLS